MTAIFASISDELATFVRSSLLSGDVLATIAVGCGIVWESGPLEVHHVAHRLVIWGIVAETICTVGLFVFDNGLNDVQVAIIRAQNEEIIALGKNSLPRSINVAKFTEQLTAAPPSAVEIRYVVACTDCEALSFWLSEALTKAHWSVKPPIPVNPPDRNWPSAVSSLHAPQQSGISVIVDSPDKITADPKTSFGALNWALTQQLGFNFNISGGVDVSMSPAVIRVIIAPKA
jgi:hypothetical protein